MVLPDCLNAGDSEDEENCKITINKKFAQKYQKFKECQELDKLKRKYGEEVEESSSSESEDDDAEALTPQIEEDFLQTLSMIKEKDPKIYEKDLVFFKNSVDDTSANTTKPKNVKKDNQPIYLKDYERKRLLEKGEKAYLSDSDDGCDDRSRNVNEEIKKLKQNNGSTYIEEQEELKKKLISAANSDSDDEENLLQIRQGEIDENHLSDMLTGSKNTALSRYWTCDKLDDGEQFLRDYILKKQFVDTDSLRIPYLDEVLDDDNEDASDAETEREDFERKYNFRYEEPDPEFIKRYPRTINESVRRKDDRRKHKRKMREERKKKEEEKKKDEIKRLKNLKRKEIMEKIEKLKEITGNKKVGFLEDDMKCDFDLSKYDELMEKVFDDEYYNDEDIVDDEKPIFPDDGEDYYEDYENYDYDAERQDEFNDGYAPHCEDPDFNMDADFDENMKRPDEKLSKKKGFNAKFAEALKREKPIFDPNQQTFEEYFDEYYKLDFEDIVDDMPIRFKYREVVPNDFGLTTDEILKADDKELNEWCSLKKTMQYIGDDDEKKQQYRYKKKAHNRNKKIQVFSSLKEEIEKQDETDKNPNLEKITKPKNIKQLQRKRGKLNAADQKSQHLIRKKILIPSWNNQSRRRILTSVNKTKVKKLCRNFKGGNDKLIKKLSLERLAAYGLDEKRKKLD